MMSARSSRLPGAVSRRSSETEMANGGFATTRKGRRGSRASLPSARTTTTLESANLRLSSWARPGCNSKAMTWAPRRSRGAVNAPVPAPISRTRSPGRIPALSTSRSAQRLSNRCHPHCVRCPGTADHGDHCHPFTVRRLCPHVNDVEEIDVASRSGLARMILRQDALGQLVKMRLDIFEVLRFRDRLGRADQYHFSLTQQHLALRR